MKHHIGPLVMAFALIASAASARQVPREFGAAGAPISGVSCNNAQAIVTRLTTNLPNQDALIAKLEAQVAAARNASNAADDSVKQQLLDAAKNEFTSVVKDYLKTSGEMKKVADALKARGVSEAAQAKLLDAVEKAKASESLWKSFRAGQGTGNELLVTERRMWDDAARMNRLFVDSGIADQVFDGLVDNLMKTPATAPAAILAKVARLGIDIGATTATGMLDAEEARRAEETLEILRAQRNKFKDKIADLTANCLTRQTTENRAQPDPNTATAPQASSGGGGGAGSIIKLVGGIAAVAGGAIAYTEYKKTMDESEELLNSISNLPTSTSTSSSNPPQTTGASAFNGTYRAQVTRSCVAGGYPAVCQQQVENATCSPTNFTFTVTSGTIRDCGTFFSTATVQSNGSYSGLYYGSAGGVPISGTFTTSGTFILQGSTTYQGSSYTVRISATRQ